MLPDAPQMQVVEPPPTVQFTPESANSVAVCGTVLTQPQASDGLSRQALPLCSAASSDHFCCGLGLSVLCSLLLPATLAL